MDESSTFVAARGASRFEALWIAGALLAFLLAWSRRWAAVLALHQPVPDVVSAQANAYLAIGATIVGIVFAARYAPEFRTWWVGLGTAAGGAVLGVFEADSYDFGYRYGWHQWAWTWSLVWAGIILVRVAINRGPARARAAERIVHLYLNIALVFYLVFPLIALFGLLGLLLGDAASLALTIAGFATFVCIVIGLLHLQGILKRRWGRPALEMWSLGIFCFLVAKELAFCVFWVTQLRSLAAEAEQASSTPGVSSMAAIVILVLAASWLRGRSSFSSGPRIRSP